MINGEDAELLISKLPDAGTPRSSHVLEGKAATAKIMHENNLQLKALLLEELEHLGVQNAAEKVASLIRPEGPVENYLLNAAEWMGKEGATAMPLAIMTSDPEIAKGISRAVDRWLHGTEKGAGTSSISTKTIQSHELLSTEARAAAAQGVDNVPLMGFGDDHYFGISASGQRLPASEFEEGLSRELVWGTHLSEVSAGSGLDVVPILQGEPQVYKNVVWKETNTGRVLIQRVGEPIPKLAQSFTGSDKTQNWVRVEEFFSTNNDLHNAATEIAAVNTLEAEHLLTSGSRSTGSKNIEVFYPWLDSVEDTENFIDTAALEELTTSGQWWGKGPERLLGYVPMTNEGGTALERMDKAWNTVLRNWFDGVVNPAIGAMVREPLFHYHFIKSYKQTEDVRSMHGHSKFAYPKLRDKRKELWRKGFIRLEGDQVRIDAFDDFIRMEWPVAKADSGSIKDLVDALESADLDKLKGVLKSDGLKAAVDANENEQLRDFFTVLTKKAVGGDLNDGVLEQFMSWANNRKLQFDRHRDVAIRRALHVTSNFIDDHRIRSQFQGMVGTMIPFWFAEDQFLRRVGRSFNHNPLIFRNANLWMMAGVHSGLVQEDQFGNKRLIYPGSGMLTRAAFEIVDNTPIVNQFFAGDLASVVKGDLTTNINVIPGYNFNRQEGEGFFEDEGLLESDMGFGPILAVPIQWASQIDPSIRHSFDNNLIGARYVDYPLTDSPTAAFSPSAAFNQMIGSITPALVQQGKDTASSLLNLAGQMDDPAARSKAAMDVVILRWMNDRLPTEAEIARQSNPAVYKERLFDEINAEATQLQLLQTMSWFFGPGTANFSDLVLKNDAWEWNQEFYDLLDKGLPYEEAYRMWQERIIAADGEFNAYEYSPFISKRGKKIPLAAMDATQEANSWLTTNKEFVQTYDLAGAFFMPRRFESDDDEYSAEARSRQIAYGLFEMQTPEEFLDQMYFRASFSTYQSKKAEYQRRKFSMRARELDTTEVTANWNAWATAYMDTHPVFAANMQGGDSKQKREATIEQFRRIVVDSSQIPDTKYRQDILMAMNAIVLFKDEMDALQNIPSSTDKRNDIKLKYYNYITANVAGKPWLNEMYYSVFMPLIGDTWLAKLEVGLLEFPRSAA